MSMISDPSHLLFLASVAMVIAFYVAGEMFETKRAPKPIPVRTDEAERAAAEAATRAAVLDPLALRHLPRAERELWRTSRLPAAAVRRISLD
jgi:hypothetical protein